MLIKCPECGKDNISDQAPHCPSCGYAIQAVTIEKTSKKWKQLQLIAALIIIISFVMIIAGNYYGAIGLLIGLIMVFYVRAKAWWHHG